MIIVLLIWRITAPSNKGLCKHLSSEQRQYVSRILDDLERLSDKIETELANREDEYPNEADQLDNILQRAETGLCQHYEYTAMIDANLAQLRETLSLDEAVPWDDDDIKRTIRKLNQIVNVLPAQQ